jgi:hypothetical protein
VLLCSAATAAQMGSSAAIDATAAAQMGSSAAIAATAAQMGSSAAGFFCWLLLLLRWVLLLL